MNSATERSMIANALIAVLLFGHSVKFKRFVQRNGTGTFEQLSIIWLQAVGWKE
ncbi:hypothetical protein Tsp_04686 [Trichinella spiralis]|uniref:hypothetical protein n=1 Tax=Trichinella spiralis TaxID=6334 RepID=UPI0001EFD7C5|nr:hypothetical protein Tsp_04686 [Trichinella spiralis]